MSSPTPTTQTDSVALTLVYPDVPFAQHALLAELVWTLPGVQTVEVHVDGDVGHEQPHGITVFVEPEHADAADAKLIDLIGEFALAIHLQEPRPIARADWEHAWKHYWHVTPIAPNGAASGIVIVPSWEHYTPQADETVLTLDPGAAFGTGTHPTTQLTLAALAQQAKEQGFNQIRILDVGCGSGILAITAAKLGCRDVVGLDVEAEAARATMENAKLNGVGHCITASTTPLLDLCRTPFDGAVMNIHWPILDDLIPEVAARLTPGGWLLVSGLIEKTVPLCEHALETNGFTITDTTEFSGWYVIYSNK